MDKLDPILDAVTTVAFSRKSYWGDEYLQDAIPKLTANLEKQIQDLKNNDLDQIESMLYSQSIILNEIFNYHSRLLSIAATKENGANSMQVHSQIALKAQNQCRNTLATLAEIKRPNRTIFVRQQNNAFNQQINCAKNELLEKNPTNELLNGAKHEALESRGTQETVTINLSVEAMDEVNRGENN